MSNIAIYLGSGYPGEDALDKSWLCYLAGRHNIFVASRIEPDLNLASTKAADRAFGADRIQRIRSATAALLECSASYSFVHRSPYADQTFSDQQLASIQNWLGIPFDYLSSLDRRFYNSDTMKDKRDKNLILQCLARATLFFKGFFSDSKIDFFVTTLEDDYLSVIAYYVAKMLDIQVIGLMEGERFPKKGTMFCRDFVDVCAWNDQETSWDEIESLYHNNTLAGRATQEKNLKHYSVRSIPQRTNSIPWILSYRTYVKGIVRKNACERSIFEPKDIASGIKLHIVRTYRRLLVQRVAREPNHADDFFLFPLHYLEDAQITFKEPLQDQYNLVRLVSRALPGGTYLYVKPHPHYLGIDISAKQLDKIRRLSNVKLINPTAPTIDLMKRSKGVVTINSTSGFEALVLGIPVITFGHDFYCKEDLCYVVRDLNEIAKTFMDALNGRKKPTRDAVQKFVKRVYSNTVWAESQTDDIAWSDKHYGIRRASALEGVIDNLMPQSSGYPDSP